MCVCVCVRLFTYVRYVIIQGAYIASARVAVVVLLVMPCHTLRTLKEPKSGYLRPLKNARSVVNSLPCATHAYY